MARSAKSVAGVRRAERFDPLLRLPSVLGVFFLASLRRKLLALVRVLGLKQRTRKVACWKAAGPSESSAQQALEASCTSEGLGEGCGASLRRIWQVRQRNKVMGKIKLFPTTEYSSKQPSDPVVPLVPCTGIFLGPSKSGKTVALISMILEQYRGVFEKIYIFSPSINIDDSWIPVKKYIEEDLGVNTERETTSGTRRRCGTSSRGSARSPRHPRSWR